jgi:hypothetical protein
MKDTNDDFAITIKEKKEIFRKIAFPKPIASSINIASTINPSINAISSFVTKGDIEKALFEQFIKKALGLDKLNFKALHLL